MIYNGQIRDLEILVKCLNENDNPQKDYIETFVRDPNALLDV